MRREEARWKTDSPCHGGACCGARSSDAALWLHRVDQGPLVIANDAETLMRDLDAPCLKVRARRDVTGLLWGRCLPEPAQLCPVAAELSSSALSEEKAPADNRAQGRRDHLRSRQGTCDRSPRGSARKETQHRKHKRRDHGRERHGDQPGRQNGQHMAAPHQASAAAIFARKTGAV